MSDTYPAAGIALSDVNEGRSSGCCLSWACPVCGRVEVGTYIVSARVAAVLFLRLVAEHVCGEPLPTRDPDAELDEFGDDGPDGTFVSLYTP